MRFLPGLGVVVALACGGVKQAVAQQTPVVPPVGVAADETLSFNQTAGFGKAELTTTEGEKHILYILLNTHGFSEVVPFFRLEEDIDKRGAQPLFLSVDKIQSIYITVTGLYFEHMVVKGKRRHILGARVLEGPVELFNYAQTDNATTGPGGFQVSPVVLTRQQWYLRRQGELVEVLRSGFKKQMLAYFQDDPVIVETLADKKMGFNDLKMLVRLYNQHHATTVPTK